MNLCFFRYSSPVLFIYLDKISDIFATHTAPQISGTTESIFNGSPRRAENILSTIHTFPMIITYPE